MIWLLTLFFTASVFAADTDSAVDLFNMQRYQESFEFFERLSAEEESSAQLKAYHAVAAAKAGHCDKAEQISSSLNESEYGEIKMVVEDNCKKNESQNIKTLTATIGPRSDDNAEAVRGGRPGAALYTTATLSASNWEAGIRALLYKDPELSPSGGVKLYGQKDVLHFSVFGLKWKGNFGAEAYFLDTNADKKLNLEYIRTPLLFTSPELNETGYELEIAGQFTTTSEIESLKGPSAKLGYWKRFTFRSADLKLSPYATVNQVVSDEYAYQRGGLNLSYQTRWNQTIPGAYLFAYYTNYPRHSQTRRDTTLGAGAWLTWMFEDSYFVQGSAEYTNQSTNVDTYKYARATALIIFGGQWDL